MQRPGAIEDGAIQDAAGATGQAQSRSASQQNDQKLEKLVAAKLLIANRGVIELSKMAVENAEHDKVKQFAQTLVEEHEGLCRDIEKLQASKGYSKHEAHSKSAQPSGDRATTPQARPRQTAQNQPGQTGQPVAGQTRTVQADTWDSDDQGIVGKLEMIAEKSAKKQLEMTKEMLQQRQGKDFDMAFVGMQIAAHTRAVADLNALQGVGSKELQDLVTKAEGATSKHLKQAKDLANALSSK